MVDGLRDSDIRTDALIHVREFGSLTIDDNPSCPPAEEEEDDGVVSRKRGSLVMPRVNTVTTLVPKHKCTGQGCTICLSHGAEGSGKGKNRLTDIFKKKKKRTNSSMTSEEKDDSMTTEMFDQCRSGPVDDPGKRHRMNTKEGSLVSRFLKMVEATVLPNLSSFKLFSNKDLETDKHNFQPQPQQCASTMSCDNRDGVIDDLAIEALMKEPSGDVTLPDQITSSQTPAPIRTLCPTGTATKDITSSLSAPEVAPPRTLSSSTGTGTKHIICPTDLDVLMGKGTKTNRHPGNIKYREIINERKEAYKALGTSKKAKKEFTQEVLNDIKGYGGRFLMLVDVKNGESYREIDDSKAREKISQKFRDK